MSDDGAPSGPRPTPRARAADAPHEDRSIWADPPPTVPASTASVPSPARTTGHSAWSGSSTILRLAVIFVAGLLVGAALVLVVRRDGSPSSLTAGSTTPVASKPRPSTTKGTGTTASTSPPTATSPPPAVTDTPPPAPAPSGDPMALAAALAPLPLPSDCPLPLGEPESLPNAARDYRGGVHEGIDFICGEYGRSAVAPLDGQVLVADASFVDPAPQERVDLLDIAKRTGHTPPWTLAMLFGRFVVLDHGIRPGVGHVVTIYAHLNAIDPSIVPGHRVKAGDRIGEIGKAGTESAGTGEKRPQAIHLHWEIHIDDEFLGHGASAADTRRIYARLFGR